MIEVNNEKEVPTMYQVKKIRLFNGREGGGFNCNLYRGNAKVAEVIEDGSGGERNGHKDTGRGVCANCETFLPSSDGEYWA